MTPKVFLTVEEYFNSHSQSTQKALQQIKDIILKVAPEATELINYNIPAYALVKNGKRDQQIMMAGYKNHVGFYPSPTTMARFEKELANYKKGKGSVQFPLNEPLPEDLIEEMVKYRLKLIQN
jgi:uncharacterized protein YdhG (YjbR/CyaY superfamily)